MDNNLFISAPRLSNGAFIGKRFTLNADPMVKKNLIDLNNLLGKEVFQEIAGKPQVSIDEIFKDERTAVQDAEDKAKALEAKARNSQIAATQEKNQADAAALEVEEAETNLRNAEQQKHTKNEEIENLKNILSAKRRAHTKAQKEADSALAKANEDNSKAQQQDIEARRMRDELLASVMDFVKDNGQANVNLKFDLQEDLVKPLGTKITIPVKPAIPILYKEDTFLYKISKQASASNLLSISDCIDKVNELSNLKHAFSLSIDKNWTALTENQKIVLDSAYGNIADYLLAYAYWVKGITEVNALFNFVTTHKKGVNAVINYALISTARDIIKQSARTIKDDANGLTYNEDAHPLMAKIAQSNISLSEDVYARQVDSQITTYISSGREYLLYNIALKALKMEPGDLPASYVAPILKYLKNSPEIDEDNVQYFLPMLINKVRGEVYEPDEEEASLETVSDADFDVEFISDEKTYSKVNVANVKCASQLFTSLVMETELDIINLANYFTDNYSLIRPLNITDPNLRDVLDLFVFDHKFKFYNKNLNRLEEKVRTKASERHYFYRQVFNYGTGPVPQGVVINTKFPRLWKQLIPTVKEYVENAASSLSSNTFVSKGGVISLITSIRNNLSLSCNSMASVMSPRINAEWNFIINKIFSHPDVINQVSPTNPSWKGVVETLYAAYKHKNVDASLAYTKAQICNTIIREIATSDPADFDDENTFINFCSKVIQLDDTIQSVQAFMDEIDENAKTNYKPQVNGSTNGNGSANGNGYMNKAEASKVMQPAGSDEWDY